MNAISHQPANFKLAGDGRLTSRLMVVKTGRGKLPEFSVTFNDRKDLLNGTRTKEGHLEFTVPGDSEIHISWK